MKLDHEHPTFVRPVIAEALCEIHFRLPSGRIWDPAFHGTFYKEASAEYPNMEPGESIQPGLAFDGGVQGVRRTGPKTIYRHGVRAHLLQLSSGVLTINELAPYPGWAIMSDDIRKGCELLGKTVCPDRLARIGLRYINRVPRTNNVEPLSSMIAANEYLPSKVLDVKGRFFVRTQYPLSATQRLIVTFADVEDDAGSRSVQLDIDAILEEETEASWSAVSSRVEGLHDSIWQVFESSIGPGLRRYLEGSDG